MTSPSHHDAIPLGYQSGLAANCNLVASRYAVDTIQHLDRDALLEIQSLLEQGETFGHWELPQRWLCGDFLEHYRRKSFDIAKRITWFIPTDLLDAALRPLATQNSYSNLIELGVLQTTRLLIILRLTNIHPSGGRSTKPLHPRTVNTIGYSRIAPMMALSIINVLRSSNDIELALAAENLLCFHSGEFTNGLTSRQTQDIKIECRRLHVLGEYGIWKDLPNLAGIKVSKAMKLHTSQSVAPRRVEHHLPLPDEYVAEMGAKCVWVLHNIAPRVTVILNQLSDAWTHQIQNSDGNSAKSQKKLRLIRNIILNQKFIADREGAFPQPPFNIDIHSKYKIEQLFNGDINGHQKAGFFTAIVNLTRLVQQASLFVLSLSSAARKSELMSWKRYLLIDERKEYAGAEGKLFKNAAHLDGDVKTWLLPEVPLFALTQQVSLGTTIDRMVSARDQLPEDSPSEDSESKPLWMQIADGPNLGHLMSNVNAELRSLARSLGMDPEPLGQNLRSHRFRTTIARLLGLAISEAPAILMEIFGHSHIDSTIYYFLSNSKLRAEIEKVVREQRVLKAKKIIDEIHLDTEINPDGSISKHADHLGGKGALAIRRAVEERISTTYIRGETWGVTDAMELAELLTLNGTSWMYVRRGVMCTKFPGETGPCNRNKGSPEPSNCSSSCDHRFEEKFLFDDVDQCIEDCVKYYQTKILEGDDLQAAYWANQVKVHVPRFPELRQKWEKNETIRSIFSLY